MGKEQMDRMGGVLEEPIREGLEKQATIHHYPVLAQGKELEAVGESEAARKGDFGRRQLWPTPDEEAAHLRNQ
jgi:hypothetical protein